MSQLKFGADSMLGSLAKKLRLLGMDTTYQSDAADSELKYLVRSRDLILLTKDVHLAASLGNRAWLVTGSTVREEFRSIAGKLKSAGHKIQPFSRCLECNELLRTIAPRGAEGRVPPYVLNANERFSECISCGKVFWEGTHRKRMEQEVGWMRKVLEEVRDKG